MRYNNMKIIKRLSIMLVLCLTLCLSGIFSVSVQAASYKAGTYVLSKNMKVHKTASESGKVIGYVNKGKKITVKSVKNKKWAQVSVKAGKGYVSLKYATVQKEQKKAKEEKTTAYKKGTYKAVNEMPVRTAAKQSAKQIGSLKKGTLVAAKTIKNDSWTKIKFDGKTAYVSLKNAKLYSTSTSKGKTTFKTEKASKTESKSTTKKSTTETKSTSETKTTKETESYTTGTYKATAKLIVRKGAGTSYKQVGSIAKGTLIAVKTIKNKKWAEVKYDGDEAYVSLKYTTKTSSSTSNGKSSFGTEKSTSTSSTTTTTTAVKTSTTNSSNKKTTAANASSIVALAKSKLGCRYVSCGKGPTVFDCSGLVYYLYKEHGMVLSGTVKGLYAKTTRVSRSDLQPGDILFFANTSKPGLCHVGIYIGNGEMIHAKGSKYGVVQESINSKYRIEHYAGAGRVE